MLYGLSANPVLWVSGLLSSRQPGIVAGYPWIDPNAGFTVHALGGFSAQQWLHGHIPWWDPYVGAGAPLAAEMQPASFFLPFVLLLHFASGVLLLKIVLQMIAGVATFLLLRQLSLGRLAAFAGAAIYGLNGTFAWFFDSPIMPIAFLPLLLLGVERAFASAGGKRRGGWILIAVALAYSIYAGFPEAAYLDGLLALAWSIYRFSVSPRDARWAFAWKVAIGGVVGLLIAAPIVIPFLEYQSLSAIRHNGWSHVGLPRISLAGFLMPYVFGPLHAFESADQSGLVAQNFGNTGGYFSLTVLLLCVTALFSGRRLRGLRILLGIWIAVFAARTLHLTLAEDLLKFIPPLDYVAVFHYSEPSWELCGAVLAAFALDDWRQGAKRQRWSVLIGAAVAFVIAVIALGISSDVITQLFSHAVHYSRWFWGSALWAAAVTGAIAILLLRRPGRRSARALVALIVLNSAALFAIPELAGMRHPKLDLGAVNFLHRHLGLERMYTLLPIEPNYGSYFQIASINHNAVPIAANWVQYIQKSLDPAIDPHMFTGYLPAPLSAREDALREHIGAFETTTVKYIVTAPGEDPFAAHMMVTQPTGSNTAVPLKAGEQISGTIPAVPFHRISTIGVMIGTYGGASTGSLAAQVCSGNLCGSGSAALADAADNQSLHIPLNPPVTISGGSPIRYTFTHAGNSAEAPTNEVAIWTWPAQAQAAPIRVPGNRLMPDSPEITLGHPLMANPPPRVFHSKVADIYELPHPAPYFEAQGGPCALSTDSRKMLRASCKSAAVLLRRELYYPGWRAYVNGKREPIRAQSIFESIALPAGDSRISFAYSPTHIGWAYAAMIAGLLAICMQLIADRAERCRVTQSADALVAAD
ncbi:MAG: hypothetical protein ACRD4O_15605 [Bryobacteraceae bacterium]